MPDLTTSTESSTLSTTPATLAELDGMVRIEEQSFSAPWSRKMFEAELSGNPFAQVWAAWSTGQPRRPELIGYVCFWVVFEELRLMNLAVVSSWRRRGTGRELVRRVLAWGCDNGARRALLEVRASNMAAMQLYQQAGFRVLGRRERYYTNPIEDAILMGLEPISLGVPPVIGS
jgi:[ribosomal protein S18]-alanine N-acetyltransferase